jgi:hypothetical protein
VTAMKALTMTVLLVGLHACVAPEDLGEQQQEMRDEHIHVHDCRPGFVEVGEGDNATCIEDPWWGWGGGGGGGGGDERGGGGGGGGGRAGGPGPIPDRKDCGGLRGRKCDDCCFYNFDRVDGERCRRIKSDEARARCWRKAADINSKCEAACHRGRGTTADGAP